MEYIDYTSITGMHFEPTTKCNAACPMCGRNYHGKIRENLKVTELTLADCKRIFNSDFLKQLKFISICGVYGDAANAKDIIDIIRFFYESNEHLLINFYTNGSVNSPEWWGCLAKVLKNGYVIFGIDGIGSTSTIHRRNTNFKKVMRNALAFMEAGGKAKWDYIAFKHNEDQIETAKMLSKALGFEEFQIKKTSRFFKTLYESDTMLDSTVLEYGKHPIYSNDGKITGCIEPPCQDKYRNSSESEIFKIIDMYGSLSNYFDDVKIECQAVKSRGVFVSAQGEVFPCCTVYQQVCYGSVYGVKDTSELNEYAVYQKYNLSAFDNSIRDIVEGGFFTEIQERMAYGSLAAGKPKACCRTCGISLDMHLAQHSVKR